MDQLKNTIRQMIGISEPELNDFLHLCYPKNYSKKTSLSKPGSIPNEIFFIGKGLVRVLITDKNGLEHTIHFAMENQFIADYANFIQKQPSAYTIQAIETTELIVMPRSCIEWGYQHLTEGQKMGRLIAEYYYIYQDSRIQNLYARTPKERYDSITDVFPNLHNRVPQHMIASYLGITPVHLSRLKANGK